MSRKAQLQQLRTRGEANVGDSDRLSGQKCNRWNWKELQPRRIWNNVKVGAIDDCWPWTANTTGSFGYGVTRFNRKLTLAHRAVYQLTYGLVPKGILVCHHCDNPICVNPNHLFIGTYKDNAQDCSRKGRCAMQKYPELARIAAARLRKFAYRGDLRGEAATNVKLKEREVLYIRSRKGIETAKSLGEQFHVTDKAIEDILSGRNWKHLLGSI